MNIPNFSLLRLRLILAISLLVFCASEASANIVVFNTLGPGDTYRQNAGVGVDGINRGLGEIGAQFTAGASGFLATVDLGITKDNDMFSGAVNVFLYGDANGIPDNANQSFLGSATDTAMFG